MPQFESAVPNKDTASRTAERFELRSKQSMGTIGRPVGTLFFAASRVKLRITAIS